MDQPIPCPVLNAALAGLNPDFLRFWRRIDQDLEDERHYLFASDDGTGLVMWIGYRSEGEFRTVPISNLFDERILTPLLYAPIPQRAVDECRTIEHLTYSKEEQAGLDAPDLMLLASATSPSRALPVCIHCHEAIHNPSRHPEICQHCAEEFAQSG